MLDCYDCGCLIPEGQATTRSVSIGHSTGFLQPSRTHYGDVKLCPTCAGKRDAAEGAQRRRLWIIFLVAASAAALTMGLVTLLPW